MNLPIRSAITELEDSKIVDVWRHGFSRPDLIMLAVGEGDLPTPKFIADAAYQAMLGGECNNPIAMNHRHGARHDDQPPVGFARQTMQARAQSHCCPEL